MLPQILNSKGQPIQLNPMELHVAERMQRQYDAELKNALGADINFTTLTAIQSRVIEQRFFTIAPADYVPVRVGQGAWSTQLLTFRSYALAGDFETGIINTGSNNTRLAEDGAGVDSVLVPVANWAKQITWALPEIAFAAKTGNWDLVTAKEKARKTDWDLGIQKVAFWGLQSTTGVYGLLTQPDVTANTTLITKYISAMTASEFQAFLGGLISAFQVNSAYTVMPDRFVIPQADYNGLANPTNSDFPIKSKLEVMLEALRTITRNPNFQILGVPYADKAVNAAISGLNKNRYVLYRADEDTIRMDIPVDYTGTLNNTINGFQFQNVGYGQFTGVKAYRPKEVLYFDWA